MNNMNIKYEKSISELNGLQKLFYYYLIGRLNSEKEGVITPNMTIRLTYHYPVIGDPNFNDLVIEFTNIETKIIFGYVDDFPFKQLFHKKQSGNSRPIIVIFENEN